MGICASLNEEKAKLGGVAQYQKLATYSSIKQTDKVIEDRNIKAPVRKKLANLIKSILEGWKQPLKNSTDLMVKLRRYEILLSGSEVVMTKNDVLN